MLSLLGCQLVARHLGHGTAESTGCPLRSSMPAKASRSSAVEISPAAPSP